MQDSRVSPATTSPQIPLDAKTILKMPKFVSPLPTLSVAGGSLHTVSGNQPLTMRMREFWTNVLPPGTFPDGIQRKTRVWGYIIGVARPPDADNAPAMDTYIGPVIVSQRHTKAHPAAPTEITWVNELGTTATTKLLAYKYSTDQTLHWADPLHSGPDANMCNMMDGIPAPGSLCASNYDGPIPGVVHLHGGEVPPELDGGPDAWYVSDGSHQGLGYYSFPAAAGNAATYRYPNTQEAAAIWFHDHTLGVTRLNVYAGLAGAYLITDPGLHLPPNLPGAAQIVPVVLQDRMFDTHGQFFFPADSAGGALSSPNPQHPYWVPEFFGDVIVVNGKAWPYHYVEPQRFRFLFLNGSNARVYELDLIDAATGASGPALWVIGTDGGYLDAPVKLDPAQKQTLRIMPGERYDVIIDFAGSEGKLLRLRNAAAAPYPTGAAPVPGTTDRVLQFKVGPCAVRDDSYNPASGIPLRTGAQKIVRLVDPVNGKLAPGVQVQTIRQLTLNEVLGMPSDAINPVTGQLTSYAGGPLEILVNNTKWSGDSPRPYGDFTPVTVGGVTTYYSELPQEGTTETWELVNLTMDAHPIHLHLVQFQVLNRQNVNIDNYNAAYAAAFPAVPGSPDCTGGVYCPAFGPPLNYAPSAATGGKYGGNPNVDPFLEGLPALPEPQEAGWKDTIWVPPGRVTRIVVRWAPTDLPTNTVPRALCFPFDPHGRLQHGYVWHCHIIDHEDNEMMRPDAVLLNPDAPPPANRPLKQGIDY
ncbi:MAG: multicopper oxidase domain-containing protein [Planctomycetota bacterium]|nr:multicopper oxidase domain-containing protein [Planctomycetota bacterium]